MTKSSIYLVLIAILFVYSCENEEVVKQPRSKKLFQKIASSKSGIDFENNLTLEEQAEYVNYEYTINGAGIAVGDFNNDGLKDLFFCGNKVSDKLYLNKGDFTFEDITQSSGITKGSDQWSTGVTAVDINLDGFLDIYVCRGGDVPEQKRKNVFYINQGDGTFIDKAIEMGLANIGHSTQAAFFDMDLDGDLDIYIVNHPDDLDSKESDEYKRDLVLRRDRLYENQNGKFIDITNKAGLELEEFGYGLGIAVADYNKDGYPDIYVSNDFYQHEYLYLNKGNGTFEQRIHESMKHTSFFSMGCDMADYDNDGWIDIMSVDMVAEDNLRQKNQMSGMNPDIFWKAVEDGLGYQYMYNALQRNNGNGTFSDLANYAGVTNTDWSWAPLFADLDNDGYKDLFISNGYLRDLRNKDSKAKLKQGNGTQVLASSLVEYYTLFPSTPIENYCFQNSDQFKYKDVSHKWGLAEVGFSNGAVYADLNNDGFLDLVLNNLNSKASVYQNTTNGNNFLEVKVDGPYTGARVELSLDDMSKQYIEIQPTRGYLSSVQHEAHFGLGQSTNIQYVKVTWPDGRYLEVKNPTVNQVLQVQYEESLSPEKRNPIAAALTECGAEIGLDYAHIENEFDDFKKEVLLPHKNSNHGPSLAVGDINGDNLEDVFVGGAIEQAGRLYVQNPDGNFTPIPGPWIQDVRQEDMGAAFFDADNDGDLDLYVVSGGNEYVANSIDYKDRLYLNEGNLQFFKSTDALPDGMHISGKVVEPCDFDNDGDIDLFIGGRLTPTKYPFAPRSYLLQNDQGKFTDVTATVAPGLLEPGLVACAVWMDYNSDGLKDLVVSGEWMPILLFENNGTEFTDKSAELGLDKYTGWWSAITAADLDGDGDQDLVLGNNGTNYKYKASPGEPFEVYAHDFDKSGSMDIVLGYFNDGTLYPVRGKQCSSEQIPSISTKFKTYTEFGNASLRDVYGDELDNALHLEVASFASVSLINEEGSFTRKELPRLAQISAVNGIVAEDINGDEVLDLVLAGNLYSSEVETTRNDASEGIVLVGQGDGTFREMPITASGFYAGGDVKDVEILRKGKHKLILVSNNNDKMQAFKLK